MMKHRMMKRTLQSAQLRLLQFLLQQKNLITRNPYLRLQELRRRPQTAAVCAALGEDEAEELSKVRTAAEMEEELAEDANVFATRSLLSASTQPRLNFKRGFSFHEERF